MQRIYFEKLTSWLNILLLTVAAISIAIGFWGIDNPNFDLRWLKYINSLGYLLLVIFFGKMFIRRNYVGWNKFVMFIRIDTFFGKTIQYQMVKEAIITDEILTVFMKDGNHIKINKTGLRQEDLEKLASLIKSHIN